jgi:copper resistance protein C
MVMEIFRMKMHRRRFALLFGAALAAAVPRAAIAHAHLDHAQPAVGSTVAPAPTEVRIWFTQKLEPAFSKIEVRDASGAAVDNGNAAVDAADASLLHVSLKPLKPGTYKVNWHAVSVDTHSTEGDFAFSVK